MKSPDHIAIMGVLRKMKKSALWARMPRKKGVVKDISLTKSGNLRLVLQACALQLDEKQLSNKQLDNKSVICYVLKRNKNLFATANLLKKGAVINVALRRALGKLYCTQITKSVQRKLEEF